MISTNKDRENFVKIIKQIPIGGLCPYWPYEDEAPKEAIEALLEIKTIHRNINSKILLSIIVIIAILVVLLLFT